MSQKTVYVEVAPSVSTLLLGSLTFVLALAWSEALYIWIRQKNGDKTDISLRSALWYAGSITVIAIVLILVLKEIIKSS